MPAAQKDLDDAPSLDDPPRKLPFPPITTSQILNCSYHSWYPKFRSHTPKARLVPLPPAFISYLRADGIILPLEDDAPMISSPSEDEKNKTIEKASESDSEDEVDPSSAWSATHAEIGSRIKELGGCVMPKLNWSAPKDAAWISATNSLECRSPNDIYLLLKSSDFVTHDLEQAFDGCEDKDSKIESLAESGDQIPYHLVLRKTVPAFNPSMEFRCFVRDRTLIGLCQRDLNHFDFLPQLVPKLRRLIQDFFDEHIRDAFPESNFTFDVYIPTPHERVWVIDFNPWAPRTDPLLFSWLELLELVLPDDTDGNRIQDSEGNGCAEREEVETESDNSSKESEDAFTPEFRLINRDDPEAYSFNTPQYSAHKLPKDVVDAGTEGGAGLRDFLDRWRDIEAKQEMEDSEEELDANFVQ